MIQCSLKLYVDNPLSFSIYSITNSQFDSLPKDIRFSCGTIEHNNRTEDINKITTILNKNNYKIIWSNKTGHDLFFVDNDFQH